jgi:NAD-dependent SIR2 family protein deacetylase
MPFMNKKKAKRKALIVNLQPTSYDDEADLVIHATCDDVMNLLMNELKKGSEAIEETPKKEERARRSTRNKR